MPKVKKNNPKFNNNKTEQINLNKKVFIENLGCNRRGLDASRIAKYFVLNECEIISDYEKADILVLFTCAFTEVKEKENLEVIKKYNTDKRILIILGCLSTIASKNLEKIFNGLSLSTKNIDKIENLFPEFKISFKNIPDTNFIYDIESNNKEKKAILRIANGCIGKCSYCAIHFAIGKLKSKSLETCINEYITLLNQGNRKFIINSEDCGYYGLDINSNLSELLNRLSSVDINYNVEWFIQTLNPKYAKKYKETLLKLIKQGKITRLKCDIQSGSKRILKLMKQFSNVEEIRKFFSEFKKANTNLYVISQFIIGFPSETEEEFLETVDLMENLQLDQYEVFPYSDREGTLASKIKDKIPQEIIKRRLEFIENY